MKLLVNHNGPFWKVIITIPYKLNNTFNFKQSEQLKKWCNETLTNKWTYVGFEGSIEHHYGNTVDIVWHFSNEEDAMLFELTWG